LTTPHQKHPKNHVKALSDKHYIYFIKIAFRLGTSSKILQDKSFIFVGQGTDRSTYKNTLKPKPYKAYGVLLRYAVCHATSNKKYGFVLLRPARLALLLQPKLENPSKYI
jgi:hypothetical protein